MDINAATYTPMDTVVHRADPRVKVALMLAYSITLFCVHTWTGLALCALAFGICAALVRLPVRRCAVQLVPLWVILAVALSVNSLSLNAQAAVAPTGMGAVSAGVLTGADPVLLAGPFGFVPEGFARGCYYVIRVGLLALASMVVTTSTSSTDLSRSLEQFLSPLQRIGVPSHDVATIVSIALRFIPVTFSEFQVVKAAQQSRGAAFEARSVVSRLKVWATVLIPVFVGLFRHADGLATAMESRCYGMGKPTHLHEMRLGAGSATFLLVGCAGCAFVAWAL